MRTGRGWNHCPTPSKIINVTYVLGTNRYPCLRSGPIVVGARGPKVVEPMVVSNELFLQWKIKAGPKKQSKNIHQNQSCTVINWYFMQYKRDYFTEEQMRGVFLLISSVFILDSTINDHKIKERILFKLKRAVVIKLSGGLGSLEKFSNQLTGKKSEFIDD